jgi:hypothetical protein
VVAEEPIDEGGLHGRELTAAAASSPTSL